MHQLNLKNINLPEFMKNSEAHKFFILLIFLVNFFANFTSPYSQLFDSALFKLQLMYPVVGLQPYKDFVFIYPFGPSLISIFITKVSHGLLNPLNLVWVIHLLLQLILIKKIIESNLTSISKIPFFYFFLLVETLVYVKFGGEPYSTLLTFITLIEFFKVFQNNRLYFSTFIYPTLLVFFRWDKLLFCLCAITLFFILCKVKKINLQYESLYKIIVFSTIPFFFLLLSLCLFNPNNFFHTLQYIFVDPFTIAKYRNLPFVFSHALFSLYNLYYLLIFVYLFIFAFLIYTKFNSKKIFFFCMGLCLIPPTLGRSDVGHFIPFYCSSFFLFYSLPAFLDNYLTKNLDRLVIFIKSISIILIVFFVGMESRAPVLINTCADLKIERKPKSIFVGNVTYDSFVLNFPLLYLNYLYLKPATKYISDEPGLQNTCSIQNEIISDINKAPKPTIFFINKTFITDKNNKNVYSNCGKIEEFLDAHTKIIGQCNVSEYNLDVRISK